MSKKLIIMAAAAGLISFFGAFGFVWLTKTPPPAPSDQLNGPTAAHQETGSNLPQPDAGATSTVYAGDSKKKKAMTERQLKSLVYDVREKMREYNNKLQSLELREQRLQMAQDTLKRDIEKLNNLRIELTSTVASLKSQRDRLLKSRVEITRAEKNNLMSIAATYDKMDAASAGKILTNMCASRVQNGGVGDKGSGVDDVVKILHYMAERTKAKLLAELVTSEPKLAAALCRRLKQITEE